MAGIGVALLALLSMPAVADLMVRPLEDMTAPLTAAARAQGQAIVVLAAGRLERAPEYGGADIPDYVALARLRYAARLQHETGLPVLVSGGNVPAGEPDNSKARAMAAALRDDFRTPVRWIEGRSENTEQNALFSAEMLRGERIDRVLVVTDAMHMPRAMLAFAQTGLQAIAAPTMFFRSTGFDAQSLLPSAEGLRRSYYASYEWIGLLWYALRLNPASRT
ncbi:YdcF family protein [Herbaspirillum robiniae]|nr:YdcF family protein [Herbaspirillum robiniae]